MTRTTILADAAAKLAIAIAACLTLAAALPAQAEDLPDGASAAVLAAPVQKPMEGVIDGRIWHCDAAACTASASDGAQAQTLRDECHRAAKWLGPFTAYQTGAKALTPAELTTCNVNANPRAPHIPS